MIICFQTIYIDLPKKKKELERIYDTQLKNLNTLIEDIYVQTWYRKTHVVNIGDKNSIPLICLHGGNSNTPDMLKSDLLLLDNFNTFSIDTIGHPGKSDETRLSSKDLSYGYWLLDVIDELQLETTNIYSGSFGAGIAIRLTTVAPNRINELALIVPSGIANRTRRDQLKLLIPYFRYRLWPTI